MKIKTLDLVAINLIQKIMVCQLTDLLVKFVALKTQKLLPMERGIFYINQN